MTKKNDVLTTDVLRYGADAAGICKTEDGLTAIVPGALPGERIETRIEKVDKRCVFGKLLRVLSASPERVAPPCPVYDRCGGCACLHMTYDETLRYKRALVEGNLKHIGGVDIAVPPVLGMENPYHYRNKTAMPVSGTADSPVCGYYAPRSHRLVAITDCLLVMKPSGDIAQAVLSYMKQCRVPPYDEQTHTGLVRHIVTRVARDGRAMVTLCVNGASLPDENALVDMLKARVPGVVSICLSENTAVGNVILGRGYRVLYGEARLRDTLCGLSFDLSPLSFFQVNHQQTEKLYAAALDFAGVQSGDVVADLYSGAGTISLLLAQKTKRVVGIESVPQAVEDAKQNAVQNGVENADFRCGLAEALLPGLVESGLAPDIVVLDPPRKGADERVLRAIAQARPRTVVYVSCDSATQARDAKILCGLGYAPQRCQSVDMFCFSGGVENVLSFTPAAR